MVCRISDGTELFIQHSIIRQDITCGIKAIRSRHHKVSPFLLLPSAKQDVVSGVLCQSQLFHLLPPFSFL